MEHCEKEKRKANPRERANIFSLILFGYTLSLFRKGWKKEVDEKDLYEVLTNCRSKDCGDKSEKQWKIENKNHPKSPSVIRMLWARCGFAYTVAGLTHLAAALVKSVIEPYAMGHLITCFEQKHKNINKAEAMYYAALLIGWNVGHCLYFSNIVMLEQRICIQIRTTLSSLLYRKALKLSTKAISDISMGNIVTLMTKDVHILDDAIYTVTDAFISFIQCCVICCLLYNKMGAVGFIGVSIILCAMPVQMFIGLYIAKLRLILAKKTDERLQATQETLSAIKIVKMYTWEKFFSDRITQARRTETNTMMWSFLQRILINIIGTLSSRLGFYIVIMSYIWLGYSTSTELIFYVLTLFGDLMLIMNGRMPFALGRGAELYSAIYRIGRVLRAEELDPTIETPSDEPKIHLKSVTIKINNKLILDNISLSISKGLTVVTGFVASGKSSLLKTILKDYLPEKGTISVLGRVSYASQEPWLFPSSIKQNILFGEKYDENRYREVLRVCALNYDLNLLGCGDETILSDKGINLSKGQQARVNLARAVYRKSDVYLLDDSLTALDAHVQDFIFKECIKGFLKDKICVFVTQNPSYVQQADELVILDKSVKYFGKPDAKPLKELGNIAETPEFVETEPSHYEGGEEREDDGLLVKNKDDLVRKKVYSEIKKQGVVEWMVYKKFTMLGGGVIVLGAILFFYSSGQFAANYSSKLLTKWVDLQQKTVNYKLDNQTDFSDEVETIAENNYTIQLYSIMILTSTVLTLIRSYLLFNFCRRASLNMHKEMLSTVINAVMSFFDNHFIGNIINRFSQDLDNIDESLPFVLNACVNELFELVGATILIISVNYLFIIPASVLFVIIAFMALVYLRVGRSLKRLEAACRSPMLGYVNASLEGMTTIRAYHAENILQEEFDRHQDLFTSARYTWVCSIMSLRFFSEIVSTLVLILIILFLLFVEIEVTAGAAGLALTQMLVLMTTIRTVITNYADLENHMTSVERTLEFTVLKKENRTGAVVANWPSNGSIRFEKVSLCFNEDGGRVLDDINFVVEPRQKIGIVGRTGAGKSSIISTLFRLYDYEGKITVDGIDISTLSLDLLRESIAIIPQDPTIFTGTIRTNFDPKLQYKDEEIWQAIRKVKLDNLIDNLETEIKDHHHFFSAGQKQLMCLARAIIHKNQIVVLDEATANMDSESEVLLQEIIRENFRNCTVLTIAHRMNSILDCDKVMVLNKGQIVEYDEPEVLLNNKKSMFYKMLEPSGALN